IVLGIDRHVRTHRISSPRDRAMLAAGAPNACNLCHLDRSVRWTRDELHLPGGGESDTNAGETWLASKQPAIRLVAASAYTRAPKLAKFAWGALVRGLDDPLPYVRAWTLIAIEGVVGHTVDVDVRAPSAKRRAQIAKLVAP